MISILLFTFLAQAKTPLCEAKVKPTGFTQVLTEKAIFHKAPDAKTKKASYLVKSDFVQVLATSGGFACVIFRNYAGYGGKKSVGWISLTDLEPVRKTLMRKDLMGHWNKIPCENADSCSFFISEEGTKLSVDMSSYMHERPSESYEVGQIKEVSGRLILTEIKGSDGAPKKVDLEFGHSKEPGTVELQGAEGWEGVYRR